LNWLPAIYRIRILAVVIAMVAVAVYCLIPNRLYSAIEQSAYDQMLRLTSKIPNEPRMVLVDIDERSLAEIGPWPWSRAKLAELIHALTDNYQVALLGVDIVFPEHKSGDVALKRAFSHPNVVLSQVLDFSEVSKNHAGTLADLKPVQVDLKQIQPAVDSANATGYIANHLQVLPDAPQVGHISPILDQDGKVRRIYPVACLPEGCSLSLSLRMYQILSGAQAPNNLPEQTALMQMQLGEKDYLNLPLDASRAMMVPYRVASGGFQYISASDILEGRTPKPQLENLLVLLGSTALGLGDHVVTPMDNLTPGIEIHAQLLSAAMDRAFIKPVAASAWLLVGEFILIGLTYCIWPWRNARGLIVWVAIMLIAVFALAYGLFEQLAWWVPLSPMPINIMLLWLSGMLFESARLNRQIQGVTTQFNRFLPASLVKRILVDRALGPDSELCVLTVLIADMRGFTEASEGKPPEAVAELAQRCLETLSEVVNRFNGTIEKYTGDGLMALWGAPMDDAQHAEHAVKAGIAMQEAVALLAPWFVAKGFKPLKVSVGINTGEMAVGIFGGASHLAWTAQGDAFNTASRIEQLTRIVGHDLLLGEATAQLIGMQFVNSQGVHQVKGLSHPVEVYALKSDFVGGALSPESNGEN
jgi:adenylate cyclase